MTNDVETHQLIDAILRQKMNLTREVLLQMIADKKEKIGAGYLTDQGALFLVAADLGVMLEQVPRLEMKLKDIYAGSKEVTVIARVMNIYPLKKYLRKDGSEAKLRTITIYDSGARLKLKLWDEMADAPDRLGMKPGDVIRISKAYARAGIDGKLTLNGGVRTTVELAEGNVLNIPDVDSLAKDPSEITATEDNIVLMGTLTSSPRIASFVNLRGEQSKVLHMQITGSDGKSFRVVLWNVDEERVPKVMSVNAKLKLIGVRTKLGRTNDTELHGDEGTVIELLEEQHEIDVMPLRIISGTSGSKDRRFALAIDRAKRIYTLSGYERLFEELKPSVIVECVPSRIYGTTLLLYEDAYVKVTDDDTSFPAAESLERKVKDVKPSQDLYFLEAITLSAPQVQDIQLKDGNQVKFGEVMIGDDTAEIRLIGWRETSNLIGGLGIGQRIKVYGVDASTGRDGNTELSLRPFSSIIKI